MTLRNLFYRNLINILYILLYVRILFSKIISKINTISVNKTTMQFNRKIIVIKDNKIYEGDINKKKKNI